MTVVDLIDDEKALATKQAVLDEHNDLIPSLSVRILALDFTCMVSMPTVSNRDQSDCLESHLTNTTAP